MKICELNYSMVQESVYSQGGKGMLLTLPAECILSLLCLMNSVEKKAFARSRVEYQVLRDVSMFLSHESASGTSDCY